MPTCSGSHYLTARLAIEHPSRPTIIDSVGCSRPTLFTPEPRLLILGSQSAPWGSHYLHRAKAWRMTALVRADGRSQAPQKTGGINILLDCCDLHLAALTFTIILVTTMVLVTASTRSGRASRFLMVRRIGCAVCRQPEPVGLGSARRMPNHLRKIRTCHGLEDRLRGVTPQTPGVTRKPTRTSPRPHADHPWHTRLGSRDDGSAKLATTSFTPVGNEADLIWWGPSRRAATVP
jgi:hypothetical protein